MGGVLDVGGRRGTLGYPPPPASLLPEAGLCDGVIPGVVEVVAGEESDALSEE